jgi:hypothetical protein
MVERRDEQYENLEPFESCDDRNRLRHVTGKLSRKTVEHV